MIPKISVNNLAAVKTKDVKKSNLFSKGSKSSLFMAERLFSIIYKTNGMIT